jgi:glycosyltransferase involved in cell wall biosynthesis
VTPTLLSGPAIPSIDPATPSAARPLISVMIPSFNSGAYLRETLRSVLEQDLGPDKMEIQVVDNCSTSEDPREAVGELGAGRVSVFRQPVNVGAIENFNSCIRLARGDWVHILHADDTVRPGFYARAQQVILSESGAGAYACRHIYINETGLWMGFSPIERAVAGILSDGFACDQLLNQRIQFVGMLVKRSVYEKLGGFRPELKHTADWDMWSRIAVFSRIFYDPEPLACYRLHAAADSATLMRSGENIVDERRAIELLSNYVPPELKRRYSHQAKRACAVRALRRARDQIKNGQIDTAAHQIKEAIRTSVAPMVLARLLFVLVEKALRAVDRTQRSDLHRAATEPMSKFDKDAAHPTVAS